MGEGLLHLWMSGGIMGCGRATPNEATGMLRTLHKFVIHVCGLKFQDSSWNVM
jgi:hypothetical protein